MKLRLIPLLLLAFAGASHAEYRRIDGIAAVVQDEIITASDLEEQLQLLLIQMRIDPSTSPGMADSLRGEVLSQLIDNILVVKEAERQGIKASDAEIDARLEGQIREQAQRIGGQEALEAQLAREGVTLKQLRQFLREDIRRELLSSQLVGAEVSTEIEVTAEQVAAYYASHRAEFPAKPDAVRLRHLLVSFRANPDEEKAALEKLEAARARILAGEDFAEVAKQVSKDPTAPRGGDMGFLRKEDLADPLFAEAAFALADSSMSEIVRSHYGLHIIQRLETRGKEAHFRHIVFPHVVTAADKAAAKKRMDAFVARLRAGEDFLALVREGDDAANDGELGSFPIEGLYPQFREAIAALAPLAVTPVIEDEQGYHMFQLLERSSGGTYELAEISPQIRDALRREEIGKRYRSWVDRLRERSYVEIRNEGS